MRTKYAIQLTDEQRAELEQLTRTGKAAARVQNRSRILLMADRGKSDAEIVDALSISHPTVERNGYAACAAQKVCTGHYTIKRDQDVPHSTQERPKLTLPC